MLRNTLLKASSGKAFISEAPIEEKYDLHVVVKIDGQVVGTLLLHPISRDLVQVKQVAISETCQGMGIGKQLLEFAENLAKNLGFKVLFLTGREQAWRFYEKLAYVTVSESYQEEQLWLKVFKKELQVQKINVERGVEAQWTRPVVGIIN